MKEKGSYYFVGIGGSGMSSLAQLLKQRGCWVGGSDRNFDRDVNSSLFDKLRRQGIELFPQNGSGISEGLDSLIVSTAIEEKNQELKKAQSLMIPVAHRAEMLARLFNSSFGVGIAGTSGKSTVTGMVASILEAAGMDPSVVNGGVIKGYESSDCIGNAKSGNSHYFVSEIDESDGSIIRFAPSIGAITNIAKDHKEIHELKGLFQTFASKTSKQLVINADCPELRTLAFTNALTFGLDAMCDVTAEDIELREQNVTFFVEGMQFSLSLPGLHNVYNALAAIAVGKACHVPPAIIQKGIAAFKGIKRRLDLVGQKRGVIVIDDFAHNPEKITASVSALRNMGKRLVVLFQPHGYGPTRFLLNELAAAFSASLRPMDSLFCLDIYDAGGTADRSISSQDLLRTIHGPNVVYARGRKEAVLAIKDMAKDGDVVAVMGARDDTLSDLAEEILNAI